MSVEVIDVGETRLLSTVLTSSQRLLPVPPASARTIARQACFEAVFGGVAGLRRTA